MPSIKITEHFTLFDNNTLKGDSMNNPKNQRNRAQTDLTLDPNKILIAEFEYARETAKQAMDDRHKMINFYLIIFGVVFTAVVELQKLAQINSINSSLAISWNTIASGLLIGLFIIGFLYILKLVRLRQAWRDSALCMNKIKNYYSARLPRYRLNKSAFRWTTYSLPVANKPWTLFFFSAVLIMILDSSAFISGLIFTGIAPLIALISGIVILIFQFVFYQILLANKKQTRRNQTQI